MRLYAVELKRMRSRTLIWITSIAMLAIVVVTLLGTFFTSAPPTAEANLRHLLESDSPEALAQAWSNLSSRDRFLRFAGRAACKLSL